MIAKIKEKRDSRLWMATLLGGLSAMAPICTDLYLPALPQMSSFLNAGTAQVQLSLTSSLIGIAIGQIFVGPFSDARGRKMPLVVSLLAFIITSYLCAVAGSIEQLILFRFLQGLAGSGGIVLSRAMACDMYSGPELTKFFALLMLINGVAPIIGPMIGGQILQLADWTAIFYFLVLCGVGLFLAVTIGCNETLPAERRNEGGLAASFKAMGHLMKNKVFMCYVMVQGLTMAGFFGYIAASPFVLQEIYGLSAQQYSLCFGLNGIGVMLVAQLTAKLCTKYGDARLLLASILVTMLGGSFVLAMAVLEVSSVWLMLLGLLVFVSCLGATMSTSFSLAVASQKDGAGSASGLLGVAAFIFGAVASPIVGMGGSHTAVPMGIVMLVSSLLVYMFFKLADPELKK